MTNSVLNLDFYLIDTRHPKVDEIHLCEKAFQFWKSSWQGTYNSLNASQKIFHSDDFLDREVSALFHKGEPIALFFNNWLDVSRDSIVDHSYFKNHPPEVIQFLRDKHYREVMFLTYMTVHADWRARLVDVPLPDLLFSLSILRFWELGQEVLSGYIRTDKSFFASFYRHGAAKISSGEAYNVPVDFCYVTGKTAKLSDEPGVKEAAEFLWNKMKNKPVTPKEKPYEHRAS